MDVMKVYNKLPVFVQNIACYYEGMRIKNTRFSKEFWRLLSEYESRNDWSYSQLCEFRNIRLQMIIEHCYNTVPYYTSLFNELGINYKTIKTLEDLKVLPILSKETVKDNFNDFISTAIPKKDMIMNHTNGTTGSGFHFYTTSIAINEQWALWWRYRKKLGISMDKTCAIFGGKPIVPVTEKKPPYWRLIKPLNQIYFSIYNINDDTISDYINALCSYKIKWIHGYPSAISLVASHMIEQNIKLDYKLDFITTGSESLLDYQKNIITKAFGVEPRQHYGLAEGVANISEDTDGQMYVDEDFAAVEFVDFENEGSHIIGTTLSNYAMPLLRYDTKDIVRYENKCIDNIRGREVIAIDGRREDYITLRDGTKIGRLAHVFADVTAVKEAQVYQRIPGEIIVKIVKSTNYTDRDEKVILSNLRERLGTCTNIIIEYKTEISKGSSGGKLRFVISEVK